MKWFLIGFSHSILIFDRKEHDFKKIFENLWEKEIKLKITMGTGNPRKDLEMFGFLKPKEKGEHKE